MNHKFAHTLIEADLEKDMSLSEVISGEDSEWALFPSDPQGKVGLAKNSCLELGLDIDAELPRRILPSDMDLLKIDLKKKKFSLVQDAYTPSITSFMNFLWPTCHFGNFDAPQTLAKWHD